MVLNLRKKKLTPYRERFIEFSKEYDLADIGLEVKEKLPTGEDYYEAPD